ncbi:MAG TPA: HNH endonuclease signature motif containing protein [Candidatus Binatia bacterium]|jgi:5-methylcytosine-specific restriction endonuclease McrA
MGEVKSFCAKSFIAAKLCSYCGRRLSFFGGRYDSKVRDYLVPLSKGGLDIPENTVASCKECHILKADYLNYALLPFLPNRPRLIVDVKRYLEEIKQLVGSRSSIMDFPGSRR